MPSFNETQPIFVQIRERIAAMILNESAKEGEALPSVRSIAADLSVNPLTVTRAYDALVALGVVESRRGMGMYVAEGGREKLLVHERVLEVQVQLSFIVEDQLHEILDVLAV